MNLRLAFFGSDAFSIHMLNKLVHCKNTHPGLILQLDVVTRSVKPQGRKKLLIEYPVGDVAASHGLNIHRAELKEDFEKIKQQLNPNIIIAASYGKLIPASFIRGLEFGGLNVHPSLLPKWSGPSPLQYTLMNDEKEAGVTVQTLHESKFDKGDIVLQSDPIPVLDRENFELLLHKLGAAGADLLEKTLIDGLYSKKESWKLMQDLTFEYSHAPLINKDSFQINWHNRKNREILKIEDALGEIHSYVELWSYDPKGGETSQTYYVLMKGLRPAARLDERVASLFSVDPETNNLIINTLDGAISVERIKMQFYPWGSGKDFIDHIKQRNKIGSFKYLFKNTRLDQYNDVYK